MIPQTFVSSWSALFARCFVCGSIAIIWFFVTPVIAQDIASQDDVKSDTNPQLGFYFSMRGMLASITGPWYLDGYSPPIENSDDDVMPYPISFYSIKYNKNYEAIIGWKEDTYGRFDANEKILKFTLRYNAYRTKHMYMFAGPTLWYFNKKFHHTKYICDEYEPSDVPYISGGCKEGASRFEEVKTDRPDGSSIHVGGLLGVGIEYTLFGLEFIMFSHELEFLFVPFCEYKEFICTGMDLKLLGVHLQF